MAESVNWVFQMVFILLKILARISYIMVVKSDKNKWYMEFTLNSSKLWASGINPEAVARRCSVKGLFLEISQNSQESSCARVSFLKKLWPQASTFIKKETLAQLFSCELCEISKNTFSYGTPYMAGSVNLRPSFCQYTEYIFNTYKKINLLTCR